MNFRQIERRLNSAIDILRIKDSYLLEHNVSERAITHKLAEYLQYVIGNSLNVDCEYNRNIEDISNSKKIHILASEIEEFRNLRNRSSNVIDFCGDDYLEVSVLPDIIVHIRGKNSNNILVIEVKKSTSSISRDYDFKKLKCYTDDISEANNLKYKFGAFVLFYTGNSKYKQPEIVWFKDGNIVILPNE
jgi:hypothetical protein